ncbi:MULTISPECIES: hypothetical protein [Clostridium]|uniref:hypothetical protein n=1 Tax=Clostridium TaxID=1485 RepID=UPI000C081DAC|nr:MULTISPECIES: hypothetical protein [Clostridium]MBS5305777.1 hypothetical protein [Clostridium sp.]MDU2155376.1 hypothetical protein [Clostridium sp.]
MVEGWNKIYRSIQEHWLWTCEPFSRGQAWIDLLLMANHKEAKIMVNGNLEVVERGQRITSIRKLSDRWKWSTKKVTHFLDQLVKDKMIEYISDSSKTVVTIVNYDKYQGKETPLNVDNTDLDGGIGNTEETQKKHEGNTEESAKKHRGNAEEKQKKTNKNDKEYIKNDKEGEERKEGQENTTEPPLLSFPTEAHKKIFNETSDTTYGTWFIDTEITETDNKITIKASNDFIKGVIEDRFKDKLYYIFLKEIEIL